MKLTTKQINDAYSILSKSKSVTLEDSDRIKLVKIRAALRPIATEYNEFDKDLIETLKFENFDELNVKAQSKALKGDEVLTWNLGFMNYLKSLEKARKPELAKEHDLDLPTISLAAYLKLEKESGWTMDAFDGLEAIIKD
jgi:hypothetical protein